MFLTSSYHLSGRFSWKILSIELLLPNFLIKTSYFNVPEGVTVNNGKLYFSSRTEMLRNEILSYETHIEHRSKELESKCYNIRVL